MNIMGELALIFGICLVGEGVAALLPVAFPASVVKDRHIQTASHFLVANMAFFFLPSFVGLLEHIELLKSQLVPLLLIIVLTTPVVYLITGWTVRLLMLRHRNRKEDRHV